MNLEDIRAQAKKTILELINVSHIKKGQILVIGCSSSEILGERIGTHTSLAVAEILYEVFSLELEKPGIYMAAQCCEHLNRSLVIERELMEKYDFEQVNAIPNENHAGGAFATVSYRNMKDPVLVEDIKAKAAAGIDIGGTLIGMHIHPIVVPTRLSINKIGEASIICAKSRIKYTGGQRAIYDKNLL